MDVYDKIQKLLINKVTSITEEDVDKCKFIQSLLDKRENFFKIDSKTITGIFAYLGVDDKEERIKMYKEVTSIENYLKYVPKVRRTIVVK